MSIEIGFVRGPECSRINSCNGSCELAAEIRGACCHFMNFGSQDYINEIVVFISRSCKSDEIAQTVNGLPEQVKSRIPVEVLDSVS